MQRVVLGRTGLSVTVMGLGGGGASRLGRADGKRDREAVKLVQTALDAGINFVDTAEAYGTEAVIGEALVGFPRDALILSTKKKIFDEVDVTPQQVVASLEQSLRRLRTDYVDIYHLHGVRPDHYADVRERLVPVLLRLREQGKIRFLGITEAFAADPTHAMLEQALADDLFDVIMVGFNILNQSARQRVLARTRAQNVGTLIMFAVRRALNHPEHLRELLLELSAKGRIDAAAAQRAIAAIVESGAATSLPDAAYRFCLAEPGAHVILSGTGNLEHLLENVASLSRPPLAQAERERLIELFRGIDDVSGN